MTNISYISFLLPALELLAAVLATIYFWKYRESNEKWFLYFLWYTFLIDITGLALKLNAVENTWLYSIYTYTSFLFFYFWYAMVLSSKKLKKGVLLLATLYIGVVITTYLVENLANKGYAFFAGSIILLVLNLLHFNQLLRSNEVVIIKYKLSFWVSTALLLFYMGILPLMLLAKYIEVKGGYFNIILLILNFILYGCFITGFIWTKKSYNRF